MLFPLRAVDAGTPVEIGLSLPGEPDFPRMFGKQIISSKPSAHGEAARAIANDHDVIGALHHGFRQTGDVFDFLHGGDTSAAVSRSRA